jgi:signal transduction histidine kinase
LSTLFRTGGSSAAKAAASAQSRGQPGPFARLRDSLNRWLGRMPPAVATLVLVGMIVVGAVAFHILYGWLFWKVPGLDFLLISALVAATVATPIILLAQRLIRSLRGTKNQLRMMTRELAIALHKAEDVNHARMQQFANMSHELRTPMNAILGFSEILRNQRFGPMGNARYLEYAGDINDSAQHLLELINNLLDLAKIEAGRFDTHDAAPIEIHHAVEMAARMVRPLAERQGVTLKVTTAEQELHIHVVERMLRQILINLLSNAVKFTPHGGTVGVTAQLTEDGKVRIAVRDSGIGMSPEEIRIAFQPFGQIDSMLSRKHAGTGLGLPLTKAMVELNQGELALRSRPGEGTEVILAFPACDAEGVFLRKISGRGEGPPQ